MERIFILGLILFLIEGGSFLVSPFSLVILTIFLLSGLYYIFKLKYLGVYMVSLIFLLRIITSLSFNDYYEGDQVEIKSHIRNGYGVIEKIDNRYPRFYKNIYVENMSNGDYIIRGKIRENTKRYIRLEIEDVSFEKDKILEIKFRNRLENMRNYMSNMSVNLIEAMIIGEKQDLGYDIKKGFRYAGASHLLAISGLHIGIVMSLILGGLKIFRLKREINYSLALVFLTVYILGINTSPSVMRAYIMGVVYLISQIIYEKADLEKSFVLAFIINLFLRPNSLGNISFVLSYLSLFTILWIYPKVRINYKRKYVKIYNTLIFLGCLQVMLIPMTLYYFKTINVLSYFTNIILTPLGSLFIGLSFIGVLLPNIFLGIYGEILENLYEVIVYILEKFEKLPYLTIEIEKQISLVTVIMVYIMIVVYINRNKLKKLHKDEK